MHLSPSAAAEAETLVRAARKALESGAPHPLLLNLRASWLEQQGRDLEALRDLDLAVRLAPRDALVLNAYGILLARLQKRKEAIAAFSTAVEIVPEFAQAHFNLGCAFEAVGDLGQGERCFARALELKPDYAPVLSEMAGLAYRRGDWDKVTEYARRALSIDRNQHGAALALAATRVAQRDFTEAEVLLSELLSNTAMSAGQRGLAMGVLADLRHAQLRFAEAFEAYTESNALKRQEYAPQFEQPGRESAYHYGLRLRDYFERLDATQWRRSSAVSFARGARQHVFLVGFPRSGTTLLENILAGHPEITTLEERDTLEEAIRIFLNTDADFARLTAATEGELEAHRAIYWRNVRRHGADVDGKVFIDKHPLNTLKLPLIARLFPEAKVLFVLRDPRDVVFSCFRHNFQMNPSMFEFLSLEGCVRFYDLAMQLRERFRQTLGLVWLDVRHEALVADLETHGRRTCEFLGVAWRDELTSFAESARKRDIATPSSLQVIKGLNSEGVGRWRDYEPYLRHALPPLQRWVEKFGYPVA